VIVLGDSHAMGWGVEQDQAFPKVLEQRTGQKTLNAAVSSFATVREMRMLDRLDTSRLRYLVVQHADNDLPENRAFKQHGNHLPITSEEKYQEIVRYYAAQQRYVPGKYLYRLTMKILRLEPPEPDQLTMEPIAPADEADLFLNALEHAGASTSGLAHVQVIVLEIGQEFAHPKAFVAALAEVSRHDGHPPFVQLLLTLDTTSILKPEDFYVLDDHMNAHGHRVVGEALADLIKSVR
jgi:lysophospholipase L1-like esterase